MKTRMAIQIFALLTLPAVAQASALCDSAANIVGCLHPTAKYQECTMSTPNTAVIRFKGGITGRPYALQVRHEQKDSFRRLVLLDDNATVPPNANCPHLQWQPIPKQESSVEKAVREIIGGSPTTR
ncbi:hypothetical protein [Paramagnetospirillum magneticum]|uniref:Uncharacterized protein n=1 Tax=Paramagnetospirillum magneticum (strain ATCC 700264 / AMB-1) TaxID=342108 RepID=Q2W4K3_PARM1|nr:hypothetical protein [Paramagnetospirillum magneticum]BAE51222.1 hypothetical protein amb2418 [Paramagnetospirillum magneticum AMB-1]